MTLFLAISALCIAQQSGSDVYPQINQDIDPVIKIAIVNLVEALNSHDNKKLSDCLVNTFCWNSGGRMSDKNAFLELYKQRWKEVINYKITINSINKASTDDKDQAGLAKHQNNDQRKRFENLIKVIWTEEYIRPYMQSYPSNPITRITSSMTALFVDNLLIEISFGPPEQPAP